MFVRAKQREGLPSLPADILKKLLNLPPQFHPGEALAEGDCFFDAVALALKYSLPKRIFTVENLRSFCHQYYLQHPNAAKVLLDNDRADFSLYENVQYTNDVMESKFNGQAPIMGRPFVEGIMLCRMLGIPAIRCVEIFQIPGEDPVVGHFLITAKDYKSINDHEIPPYSETMPVIISGQNDLHFIPLLPTNALTSAPLPIILQAITSSLGEYSLFNKPTFNEVMNALDKRTKEFEDMKADFQAIDIQFFLHSRGENNTDSSVARLLGDDLQETESKIKWLSL